MTMTDNEDSLAKILLKIVELQGHDVLLEQRLMGLVQDLTAGHFQLSPVLRNAIQAGVPQRLDSLAEYDEEERGMLIDNITLAFQDNYMLRPQAAEYIVDSLAFAMGLIGEEPEMFVLNTDNEGGGPLGEPSYVEEDDGEYCGYHDNDNRRSGFGILRKPDGSSYYGEWRVGMRMGFGLGFSNSQEKYAGQWHMNRPNGTGTMLTADGHRYLGTWKQGRRDGWAMELLPNGNMVATSLSKGKPSPTAQKGVCLLPNGDIIIGRIGPNGPDGPCLHIPQQGEPRQENWHQGAKA